MIVNPKQVVADALTNAVAAEQANYDSLKQQGASLILQRDALIDAIQNTATRMSESQQNITALSNALKNL